MIESTDIKFLLSGGATNADTNTSLGGVVSSEEIVNDTVNNLFALAPGDESSAGSTKYRGFFVKNNHGTLTLTAPKIYISSNTPSTTTAVTVALALETGSPMDTITNEDTAPSPAVTFVTAVDFANGLSFGDLAPGAVKGIWVKWVIDAGTVATADTMTFAVIGETEA